MNCPTCGSKMIDLFSSSVCETCTPDRRPKDFVSPTGRITHIRLSNGTTVAVEDVEIEAGQSISVDYADLKTRIVAQTHDAGEIEVHKTCVGFIVWRARPPGSCRSSGAWTCP